MEHTSHFTSTLKKADRSSNRLGRTKCEFCQNLPEVQQCQRYIRVTARDATSVDKKLLRDFDDPNQIPYIHNVSKNIFHPNTINTLVGKSQNG